MSESRDIQGLIIQPGGGVDEAFIPIYSLIVRPFVLLRTPEGAIGAVFEGGLAFGVKRGCGGQSPLAWFNPQIAMMRAD